MLMHKLKFFRWWWVLISIISLILCLLIYATVQQSIRAGANDPQIQIAEDIVNSLNDGQKITDFSSSIRTDIAKSLATYVVIYDGGGNALTGTGVLDGTLPSLPKGVFEAAKANGEDLVTWQPQKNVRSAIVVVPYNAGFVMAGRSLREIEKREDKIFDMAIWAWLFIVFISFIILYSIEKKHK